MLSLRNLLQSNLGIQLLVAILKQMKVILVSLKVIDLYLNKSEPEIYYPTFLLNELTPI